MAMTMAMATVTAMATTTATVTATATASASATATAMVTAMVAVTATVTLTRQRRWTGWWRQRKREQSTKKGDRDGNSVGKSGCWWQWLNATAKETAVWSWQLQRRPKGWRWQRKLWWQATFLPPPSPFPPPPHERWLAYVFVGRCLEGLFYINFI